MSVCLSALMGHPWRKFSRKYVDDVALGLSQESSVPNWKQSSRPGSPGRLLARFGYVTFDLPGCGYFLTFGRRLVELRHFYRWATLLVEPEVRQEFLSACDKVARLWGITEMILLPEGTEIHDLLYYPRDPKISDFEHLKQTTRALWGPPDLDILHYYTEKERDALGWERIHYFLMRREGGEGNWINSLPIVPKLAGNQSA
jgi:hypothetical protein